jgi:hypothetical protein
MIDFQGDLTRFSSPGLGLLRKSILSLALTFFGSQHNQEHITTKGYLQYGEVLQQLNTHLAKTELQRTNEILLTALSCMLLEVFLPTGPSNFLKHQRGIEAIMQLRGPPSETEGSTVTIFRGLRVLSIVGALADSRPSIYAKKEWKQVPPAQTTEAAKLQHEILAVLADCTRLVSERDALLAVGTTADGLQHFTEDVDRVLGDLELLHPAWVELNERERNASKESSSLSTDIGVSNHVSATAYMLYKTTYLCILQIKNSLCPSPLNIALRNAAATTIAHCLELKEYEKRRGAPQSNTIAFIAIKLAWQTLGRFDSPEGQQLAQVVGSAINKIFRADAQARPVMTLREGNLAQSSTRSASLSGFEPTHSLW